MTRLGAGAAAILTIASLITAAWSLTKLVPSPTQIEAVALSCDRNGVKLALANVGGKPGVVQAVDLQIVGGAATGDLLRLFPETDGHNDKLVVEPGKTSTLTYRYKVVNTPAPIPYPESATKECRSLLTITAVDFSGTTKLSKAVCDCPAR